MLRLRAKLSCFTMLLLSMCCIFAPTEGSAQDTANQQQQKRNALYGKHNLVAWCIVPFDAKKRGPAARAEMVHELGIRKVAYDWRAEHVSTFEQEILEYEKREIEFFAFWSWHDALEPLIKKHGIRPQIWVTLSSPKGETQADRIRQAATALLPLVLKTKELGLQIGLYNHGGWGGQPSNLLAVCKHLREDTQSEHIGIVYNFHHAHEDVDEFKRVLPEMAPYLLCLNINGMVSQEEVLANNQKIIPVGSGKFEKAMMQALLDSSYQGPIGVLDHRGEMDARESLQQNLDGLQRLMEQW
jgi:sugar phosphate isomerase/epimerase